MPPSILSSMVEDWGPKWTDANFSGLVKVSASGWEAYKQAHVRLLRLRRRMMPSNSALGAIATAALLLFKDSKRYQSMVTRGREASAAYSHVKLILERLYPALPEDGNSAVTAWEHFKHRRERRTPCARWPQHAAVPDGCAFST